MITHKSRLLKRVFRKSKKRGTDPWGHSHLNCGKKEQSEREEKFLTPMATIKITENYKC